MASNNDILVLFVNSWCLLFYLCHFIVCTFTGIEDCTAFHIIRSCLSCASFIIIIIISHSDYCDLVGCSERSNSSFVQQSSHSLSSLLPHCSVKYYVLQIGLIVYIIFVCISISLFCFSSSTSSLFQLFSSPPLFCSNDNTACIFQIVIICLTIILLFVKSGYQIYQSIISRDNKIYLSYVQSLEFQHLTQNHIPPPTNSINSITPQQLNV